jgi:hypothetical protein
MYRCVNIYIAVTSTFFVSFSMLGHYKSIKIHKSIEEFKARTKTEWVKVRSLRHGRHDTLQHNL